MSRVVATPGGHQTWITVEEATKHLRCLPHELPRPTSSSAEGLDQYEYFDIWNAGIVEGKGLSTGERQMLFYNRLLRARNGDWLSPATYTAIARAQCPALGACDSHVWPTNPTVPNVDWLETEAAVGCAEWVGRLTLVGKEHALLNPDIAHIWNNLLESYRFQLTPFSLAVDIAATRSRRVGDCTALSAVLADDLRAAGRQAYQRWGYIFGGVHTRWHSWVEVIDDDGEIAYLDPSMARLAPQFFDSKYESFCRGSLINRIVPIHELAQFYTTHVCSMNAGPIPVRIELRANARR